MKEQLIFPEIEYDKIDKIRGMDMVVCTTAKTDEEAKELLPDRRSLRPLKEENKLWRKKVYDPQAAGEPKFSTRRYNRCKICGRPHAYLRDYGICRICFRELAYKGQIPGVKRRAGSKTWGHGPPPSPPRDGGNLFKVPRRRSTGRSRKLRYLAADTG